MAFLNALRSTRFGSLKYDTDWLETGKAQDVLSLCNRFEASVNIESRHDTTPATSPSSVSSKKNSPGLGGIDLDSSTRPAEVKPKFEEILVDSKSPDSTPSSALSSIVEKSQTEDKREERISDYELAALLNERKWNEDNEAAADYRMNLLRTRWAEYQKGISSSSDNSFDILSKPSTPLDPGGSNPDVSFVIMPSTPSLEEDYGQLDGTGEDVQLTPQPQEPEPLPIAFGFDKLDNRINVVQPVPEQKIENNQQPQPPVTVEIERPPAPAIPVPQPESSRAPIDPTPPSVRAESMDVVPPSIAPTPTVPTVDDEAILTGIRLSCIDVTRFKSDIRLNDYKRHVDAYQRLKANYERVQKQLEDEFCSRSADRVTKGVHQELRLWLNTTINLLTKDNVKDTVKRLGELLSGRTIEVRGSNLSIQKHPQAKLFCCEFIARMLVKQAETSVSVNPEMAYPLATVAVSLWIGFDEIGDYLKAIIGSSYPYVIPYYVPRNPGESDQEYYAKLGYRYGSNGEIEKQHLFLKRMGGICRFWTAVMCTPAVSWANYPPSHSLVRSGNYHPLDLDAGWQFIVYNVQLAPRLDITATMLLEFLENASHILKKSYGRQYEKLLKFIDDHYMPEISAISSAGAGSAAYARLKTFLTSGNKRFNAPPNYPSNWRRI